ncbi:MAG: hypothetical protein GF400_11615 [Candidatus Eisenbacteria bacterium]|nr:hypothetical protein [Candidatus Eisenbacteria bacterium]
MTRHLGRWLPPLMLLALFAGLLLSGGCAKDLMEADEEPPTGSRITNPPDGVALNSQIIDIRGRAEVGATIEVDVNGESKGSAVAYPPAPGEGGLGRFTVPDVNLGEEGAKEIRATVTDLYGNRADQDLVVNMVFDATPPIVFFDDIIDAQIDTVDVGGVPTVMWTTGLPAVTALGRTDTTYSLARVRYGINQFVADRDSLISGAPGEPDTVKFWVPMTSPPLTTTNPDSIVTYYMESMDEAGNRSSERFQINWAAAGRETTISYEDGDYGYIGNSVSGQQGMKLAVMFQAPPWANFIIGMGIFNMNDGIVNDENPQAPTTDPFLAFVWKPNEEMRPGVTANTGYTPFADNTCPEDSLVTFYFANAINITSNDDFPDKQFFAGIEFLNRNSPIIGIDVDEPIDSRSFRWDWSSWEMATTSDYIIRAIVSDLQSTGEKARTATVTPTIVRLRE